MPARSTIVGRPDWGAQLRIFGHGGLQTLVDSCGWAEWTIRVALCATRSRRLRCYGRGPVTVLPMRGLAAPQAGRPRSAPNWRGWERWQLTLAEKNSGMAGVPMEATSAGPRMSWSSSWSAEVSRCRRSSRARLPRRSWSNRLPRAALRKATGSGVGAKMRARNDVRPRSAGRRSDSSGVVP